MYKLLLFAGTSEGRQIAEFAQKHKIRVKVFAATEYGGSLLAFGGCVEVSAGRLTKEEMEAQMKLLEPEGIVVDATHPYAVQVTENLKVVCQTVGIPYVRVLRDGKDGREVRLADCAHENCFVRNTDTQGDNPGFPDPQAFAKGLYYVDSAKAAADLLENLPGRVLLTTGSKELSVFTSVPDYKERLFARVLSLPSVAAACGELGFTGSHLICMQGPFSRELNEAMLRQIGADWLVTKETGSAGGFPEKCQAAAAVGCGLIIIGRPREDDGMEVTEVLKMLGERFGTEARVESGRKCAGVSRNSQMPKVTLVGIGMGTKDTITKEGLLAIEQADVLIGASRMLQHFGREDQEKFVSYRPEEIEAFLRKHPQYPRAAVLLSGDTGFYSGAAKLIQILGEDTKVICGISSMIYFCSILKTAWEDVLAVSLHGRAGNLIGLLREHQRIFTLIGSRTGCGQLCRKLTDYDMGAVRVSIGENLSYENERIRQGTAAQFADMETEGLCVMLLEQPDWEPPVVTCGISDDAFIRGKVPMTKEEVRSVSVSRLRLTKESVVYDVGAGTGSVSVEMARAAVNGRVYAIEKKPEAVELIYQNKKKFRADNLEVVQGLAPDALEELPVPTHAFIGGSSGNLKEILRLLLEKNPEIRVVMNAITLETVVEMLTCVKELPFTDVEITSLSSARAKTAGAYHLMMGQNPVTIVSATGGRK